MGILYPRIREQNELVGSPVSGSETGFVVEKGHYTKRQNRMLSNGEYF